jgi:hypothetical protein
MLLQEDSVPVLLSLTRNAIKKVENPIQLKKEMNQE